MSIRNVFVIVVAMLCMLPNSAFTQVSSPPLTTTVRSPVRDCSQSTSLKVPIITWGGDIPTIFANGSNKTTRKGSLFANKGLNVTLERQDVFSKQVEAYLRCETPFLRGTLGMVNMAAEVANRDPRTAPKIIHQLTWSAGGDALVVKEGISSPSDLKGKTIAVQAYGPHVDYLNKVLSDAGLSPNDVSIIWTQDLTGTRKSPSQIFKRPTTDAAMVIIPDALALTSGGGVGTGAEDSVKGAQILLSTKSANRVISDVYVVRSDFFSKQPEVVNKFVLGLLQAQEQVEELVKNKTAQRKDYQRLMSASALLLLDSQQAIADTEAMYADADFVGFPGNVDFMTSDSYPRRAQKLIEEIQIPFMSLRLLSKKSPIGIAQVDFNSFKSSLKNVQGVTVPRFDANQVAKVVSRKQQQGTLEKSGLFTFQVFFKPNQNTFTESLYKDAFEKAIDLASTYGGAVITVEGHSDPLGYLRKKKDGANELELRKIKQAAKNLSLTRATAVRESLLNYGKSKGIALDASQFAIVGLGISSPQGGMCGEDPCAPKTEQDWLNNMRVVFRILQVEAEENVFRPL